MAPALAFFYKIGCPYCVEMMPAWNEFKRRRKASGQPAPMEIEARKVPASMRAQFYAFPTVAIIDDKTGKLLKKHEGLRTARAFERFAKAV